MSHAEKDVSCSGEAVGTGEVVASVMAAARMPACAFGILLVVDSGIGDNREESH